MNTIKDTGDTAKSWEGRYDKDYPISQFTFSDSKFGKECAIRIRRMQKDFIRTLLAEQREKMVEKIEKNSFIEYYDGRVITVKKALQIIKSHETTI